MKIILELDVSIDSKFGDELHEDQIKTEILNHFVEFLTNPEPDIEFKTISVPSSKCWDCYTYITLESVSIQ